MSSTLALTGLLPFVVLIAAALAFPVSLLLLRLYRRGVLRGMTKLGGAQAVQHAPESTRLGHATPAANLRIETLETDTRPAVPPGNIHAWHNATRNPWLTALVVLVSAHAYALVMTTGWLYVSRDESGALVKLLILFWTYLWPGVLGVLLVAAYDPWRRAGVLGAYFAVLGVLFAIAVARNPNLDPAILPVYWLLTSGPASILLSTFLVRRIRAVGPLVLVFLIAIAIGSQSLVSLAASNDALLRVMVEIGVALGLNAAGLFVGLMIAGAGVFTLLGWPLLGLIGRRYADKRFSEQSITVDAIFLLFGLVQSIGFAFEGALWILTGLFAFMTGKLLSVVGLRQIAARAVPSQARTLLLLRVFALGRRSEALFNKLRTHWQHIGSISMIAGPDLVTSTIEPHEFLEFVSGRLGRQFVKDPQDLDTRLAHIDATPDPDGRYRINEFFCHGDTWQMTMERLAASSDAVVMDLRGFSP
ncbi:MAG: hypothetical protein KDK91_13090, partial [Gammaproteobacteria bacterium]|nr:hypothetical protein [Gammaproteobacteria bacterium]